MHDFYRVLQTWKQGSVFPPSVLDEIDRGMPRNWSTAPKSSTNAPGHMPFPPQIPPLPPSNELLEFLLEALTTARRDPSSLPHQSLRIHNLLHHLRIKNEIPPDPINNIERLFDSNNLSEAFDAAFQLRSQFDTIQESPPHRRTTRRRSQAVKLTFDSVMKHRPGLHRMLYEDYPLQCKTLCSKIRRHGGGKGEEGPPLDQSFP